MIMIIIMKLWNRTAKFLVKKGENHRIKNDNIFEHLFGRFHWMKKPHKPSKSNSMCYPQDDIDMYCFMGRIYRIVDHKVDEVVDYNITMKK